jgi:hypothetical protein
MKIAIIFAAAVAAIVPVFSSAESGVLTNIGNALAGEACRVPIYHTDFAFPPEGGQIIREGDQLYFVRNYLPGCGGSGVSAGSTAVSRVATRTVGEFPGTTATGQAVPVYRAPVTGCNN